MMKKRNSAQSMIGYSVLICLVAAGLLVTRVYMLRSVEGKYRQSATVYGDAQYAPGSTEESQWTDGEAEPPGEDDSTPRSCVELKKYADLLQDEANKLRAQAADFETSAQKLDETIPTLVSQANTFQQKGDVKQAEADGHRREAAACTQAADDLQIQVNDFKAAYPECFPTYELSASRLGTSSLGEPQDDPCYYPQQQVAMWESQISDLRQQAAEHLQKAEAAQAEANQYYSWAASLRQQVATMQQQSQNFKDKAANYRDQAAAKEQKIKDLKERNPGCFGS